MSASRVGSEMGIRDRYDYAYDPFGNLESVSVGGRELERTTLRSRNGLADRITYATGEAVRNEYNPEEQLAAQYLLSLIHI